MLERYDGVVLRYTELLSNPEWPASRAHVEALRNALRDVLVSARQDIAALERFKAFVHQRLDEAGVPTHPDGPHSKEGCRIGDRLDIEIGQREALAKVVEFIANAPDEASEAEAANDYRRMRAAAREARSSHNEAMRCD